MLQLLRMEKFKSYKLALTKAELKKLDEWIKENKLTKDEFLLLSTEWWLREIKKEYKATECGPKKGPHS